jgi:TonB family protein
MSGRIEVEQWRAPPAKRDREPQRFPALMQRGMTLFLVLAMHAVIAVQLLLPALRLGSPGAIAQSPVMVATFVELKTDSGNARAIAPLPPLLPPSSSVPIPDELPIAIAEDASADLATSHEFSPPRLHTGAAPEPIVFASKAGIDVSKSARVILTVTVNEEGTASEVIVTISSGDSRLDSAAIAYVRALRWDPAIVQGRQSSMNIRLPVVFAVPS